MKRTGRRLSALLVLLLSLCSGAALADVTVVVDRNNMQLGDSFRLIITATEGEELSSVNLAPLQSDFDILQRATNSQTNIVNGRRSHTKQLQIDLAPKREGRLQIPSLRVDGTITRPINIRVTAAADMDSGDQPLVFEAEVDRQEVYVQGQLLLTLRIKQAINLDNRSISELELENAFVKQLEQVSFQRAINGRNWLIHEIRYAIFPEQSGTLNIPSQVFTAREVVGRRGVFGMGGAGKRMRRATDPISIEVLARPRQFPASTWLPAQTLTIEEDWSTAPQNLRVGESATRTIRLRGEGLQGAQLPPILFTAIEGLKFYPDQPQIDEMENENGLVGMRQDSAALVPTQEGPLTLPEIRIPWWDTQSNRVRYAILPQRTITVAPGDPGQSLSAPIASMHRPTATDEHIPHTSATSYSWVWQLSTVVALLGWIASVIYLLRRRQPTVAASTRPPENLKEKVLFKRLLQTCQNNDPEAARAALQAWLSSVQHENVDSTTGGIHGSIEQVPHSDELKLRCAELDAALYGKTGGSWSGAALASALQDWRAEALKRPAAASQELRLYPRTQAQAQQR